MTIPGSNNRPNFPQCRAKINFEELHETAQLPPFKNEQIIKKYALKGPCEEVHQELRKILDYIKNYPEDTSHRKTIKETSGKIEIQFGPNKKEIYSILDWTYGNTTSWTQRENILTQIQYLFSSTFSYLSDPKIIRCMKPLANRNNECHRWDRSKEGQGIIVYRNADVKLPKS